MSESNPESVTVVSSRFHPAMALDDLNAQYLKDNYLVGLKLCGSDGQELSDDWYELRLSKAISLVEEFTNVDILERVVKSEKHDYHSNDYLQYGFIQLFRVPCLTVEEVRARYPGGIAAQVFPSPWVRLENAHSQINLVPTAGTIAQVIVAQGSGFLPLIYAEVNKLPHFWEIDYTSGMDPDNISMLVIEAICKFAIIEIFTIMSDTVVPIGVGSQSLGIDGLSQSRSFSTPAFKGRLDAYRMDLGLPGTPSAKTGLLSQIRNNYLGVNLTSV